MVSALPRMNTPGATSFTASSAATADTAPQPIKADKHTRRTNLMNMSEPSVAVHAACGFGDLRGNPHSSTWNNTHAHLHVEAGISSLASMLRDALLARAATLWAPVPLRRQEGDAGDFGDGDRMVTKF